MDFLNLFLVQALSLTRFQVKPFRDKNEVELLLAFCFFFLNK